MSELIDTKNNPAAVRWALLSGASALALTAYVASTSVTRAEDGDRPTVWIELGGQMEQLQGLSAPFAAPFMSVSPTPDIYNELSFDGSQKPARFAFGEQGKITIQPEDSDWVFSAGIRYGRSHANRHTHKQEATPPVLFTVHYNVFGYPGSYPPALIYPSLDVFADARTKFSESHVVLDFTAGRDVGLGLFGRDGSSTLNAGVRFASFTSNSSTTISGRPSIIIQHGNYISLYSGLIRIEKIQPTFYQHTMTAHAARSFKGVGPTLSWDASAAIIGSAQDGEVTFDWGINAALLFGKQKAKTDHSTQAYHFTVNQFYPQAYHHAYHSTRSRSVTVPNLGGFAGVSVKYPDAKVSFGYRADFFLGAVDAGIDARHTKDIGFFGPFATVSIGLGG